MFSPPRSLFELLKSLKDAFDRGLLSREEFYSEENLKALSGAQEVMRSEYRPGGTSFWLRQIEGLYKPIRLESATYPSIQYRIDRFLEQNGKNKYSAFVTFQDKQPELELKEVQAIFGPDWTDFPPVPIPPSWNSGTRVIRYFSEDENIRREIIIKFRPDGSLWSCEISEEAK